MSAELPCAVCRHSRPAHEPTAYEPIGATRCQLCPCNAFVPGAPRPVSGYARMLVAGAFDLSRKCVTCGCQAQHHERPDQAPDCKNCGKEPDQHVPGGVLQCAYTPGPPTGPCWACATQAGTKCAAYVDAWATLRPGTPEPPHESAQEPAA